MPKGPFLHDVTHRNCERFKLKGFVLETAIAVSLGRCLQTMNFHFLELVTLDADSDPVAIIADDMALNH